MRDAIAVTICIIALTGLFMVQKKPPARDFIALPEIKKLMALHGVGIMECKNNICSFQRNGKTVTIRLFYRCL